MACRDIDIAAVRDHSPIRHQGGVIRVASSGWAIREQPRLLLFTPYVGPTDHGK
jgi:hypothetical protein